MKWIAFLIFVSILTLLVGVKLCAQGLVSDGGDAVKLHLPSQTELPLPSFEPMSMDKVALERSKVQFEQEDIVSHNLYDVSDVDVGVKLKKVKPSFRFGLHRPRLLFSGDPYTFRPTQLIAPLVLIAVGTSSLYIKGIDNVDRQINESVDRSAGRLYFDDYMQYAPLATVFVLDACGVRARNGFKEQATIVVTSALITAALVNGCKYTIRRPRPGGKEANSSPSGHTATAFMGAALLDMEFGQRSAWISAAGYTVAALTGAARIYNNRHYTTDVIFGAGIGILSVRVAYWLAPWLNRTIWGTDIRNRRVWASVSPYVADNAYGIGATVKF